MVDITLEGVSEGDLQDQLSEKRKEVFELERKISKIKVEKEKKKWAGVNECELNYYDVRDGKCEHGDTYHGNVYCVNPNCHK
jgi:hypothetical protein